MVTIEEVRAVASQLPRSYEVMVRDRVKFRVGRIVYLAFSSDETVMGFTFPKEARAALVEAEPDKYLDAWPILVPRGVAAEYLRSAPPGARARRTR